MLYRNTMFDMSLAVPFLMSRLQAQGTPQHPQTYTSTLDVFTKTFEKEGIRGFYKGMVPTLTKVKYSFPVYSGPTISIHI